MKVNKFFSFVFIYFFLNSVALPFGLTYTTVLAPLFYVWILIKRKREVVLPFLAILFPFIFIHINFVGVDIKSYAISFVNFLLVYISCQAVYTFLLECSNPEKIFRQILVLNFIFCLAAIPFYFTSYYDILWVDQDIGGNVGHFRRLKLLTYEPSYYAFLFAPLFFYFLLQYCFQLNKIPGKWLLPMLFVPYILSFSIGVIVSMLFAGILVWISYFNILTQKRRVANALVFTGAGFILMMVTGLLYFRQNPVFRRIKNILSGEDSSGNGRIKDAFILADKLIHQKSEWWGVGIGQIKIMGETTIRNYYMYYTDKVVAIPNAVAETLTIFGWVGVSLRLGIEIFFFFLTRVWTNYYRLLLFIFVFIYQFTGSFITNLAEYLVWIFAFSHTFHEFDIKQEKE
ncbi:MAG: hypothetical protein JST09_04305 [Bacteroidetes bacterium]|nr:hypothetical protein [Bacteroidota bacterium]